MHIKFDYIFGFQNYITSCIDMGVQHNFTIYAAFHRESNAVYRFCKSYTVMKIHTII